MKLVILGAGYTGEAIARAALARGFEVTGTSRRPERLADLSTIGLQALAYDGASISDALAEALRTATHVVQSIAPGADGDPVLQQMDGDPRRVLPKAVWIGYLSTVGVYGDHDGAWVDEDTPCRPVSKRSVERVAAEEGWAALGRQIDCPLAILRLSGIYGPGRNGFLSLAEGTARRLIKPGQVFNRIRVEDIARASLFLAEAERGGIFNVTDDEPAPPQDVVTEAARLMGVAPPMEQDFATAELSAMARSFYGENKRVSNAKLRGLGFTFDHPNYRLSLAELWSSGRWRG